MPCNRCSYCCRFLSFVFPATKAIKEWGAARGFRLVQESETHMELAINHPCRFLVIEKNDAGEKQATCKIHYSVK